MSLNKVSVKAGQNPTENGQTNSSSHLGALLIYERDGPPANILSFILSFERSPSPVIVADS